MKETAADTPDVHTDAVSATADRPLYDAAVIVNQSTAAIEYSSFSGAGRPVMVHATYDELY